jgi:hypothetical protein
MQAPHRVALPAELERFERVIHRIWQIVASAGVVTGVIYALAVSRPLGLGCAATSAVYLAWFVLIGHLYDSGQASPPFMLANTLVEATIPWVFLLVTAFTKGADYALASWVPPFLYCACIVAYVPRLQPRRAAVFGAASAVLYPLLYFSVIRGRLPADAAGLLVNQPATQIARAATLAVSGLLATLLIFGLRQVFSAAGERERDPLGKYGELRPLSQGPLGAAFEASWLGHPVIVELLRPELSPRADLVGELMVRADRASRLSHPGVARVLDFGRASGGYFVVSERLAGVRLLELKNQVLASRAPLAPGIVAQVAIEILGALDALHASGLVVGGFDPGQAIVSADGAIALEGAALPPALRAADDASVVPPELARGHAPSIQTDLFSLAVVLWELLAGERRLPQHAAVSLSARSPGLDAGWDALFLRALAPDGALRPSSAREMAELMAPFTAAGGRGWLAAWVHVQKRPRS